MNVLLITPYLPYKGVSHAGGKYVYDFIAHLKKRDHKIFLISFYTKNEKEHLSNARDNCDGARFLLKRIYFPKKLIEYFFERPFNCLVKLFLSIFDNISLKIALVSAIKTILDSCDIDVVQVEYSEMGFYVKSIDFNGIKMLDFHDVMIKPSEREFLVEKNFFKKCLRRIKLAIIKSMESSFCKRFDILFARSEADKDILESMGCRNVRMIKHGVEIIMAPVPFAKRQPGSILFVGAMHRDLNENAVIFFIEKVMPEIRKRLGGVKFYIVGSDPSEKLKARASEDVIITGAVTDVGEHYSRCRVFVAPLFIGGGLIFKVLESMSYGLPVVSTSVANEGILARHGQEIMIAQTAQEFATMVVELLEDEELWKAISENGIALVRHRFSWDCIIDDYESTCSELLHRHL